MFKISLLFIALFSISTSSAQKIGLQQLEYTCQLNSIEKKSDFFMGKKFAKVSSIRDTITKFTKKIYIERTKDFDEETISLSGDTIIYSLQEPKKYASFKKMIEISYTRLSSDSKKSNEIIYRKKKYTIILSETEIESNLKPITIYNFTIYNN